MSLSCNLESWNRKYADRHNKIQSFYLHRVQNSSFIMRHGGGSIMLPSCFFKFCSKHKLSVFFKHRFYKIKALRWTYLEKYFNLIHLNWKVKTKVQFYTDKKKKKQNNEKDTKSDWTLQRLTWSKVVKLQSFSTRTLKEMFKCHSDFRQNCAFILTC